MKKFNGLLGIILSVALLIIVMSGCKGKNTQTSSSGSTETKSSVLEKDITLIVPWSPGGAADVTSRLIQKIVKEQSGLNIIVTVMQGGSGAVGMAHALEARDGGYTLGYGSGTLLSQLALGTIDYGLEDFVVASTVFDEALVLVVPADSPYETLGDMMAEVKANPGTVTVAGAGSGNVNNTFPILLGKTVDSSFKYTAFDGGTRVMTEVLGGHSDAAIIKPNYLIEFVAEGESSLRMLAVFTKERLGVFPDVPTVIEAGYDVYSFGDIGMGSFLISASEDNIPEVTAAIGELMRNALLTDEFQAYCEKNGFSSKPRVGQEAKAYIDGIAKGLDDLFVQLYN